MLTRCWELSEVKSFPGRENILSHCPLKIWRWSLTSLSSRKVQMPWWEKDAHLDPITKSVLQLPNAKHFQNLAATEVGKYALCFTLNIFPGTDPRFKEFKEVAIQTKESNCFDHVAIHMKNKRWRTEREREGKVLQGGNIAGHVPYLTFANKIFCPWTKSIAFISYLV